MTRTAARLAAFACALVLGLPAAASSSPLSDDGPQASLDLPGPARDEVRGCHRCDDHDERRARPRDRRHFGLGLTLAGPAGTVGIHAEVMPFWLMSVQAGWGLGNGRTQTAWVEARLMPVRGPWTPFLGLGAGVVYGLVTDPTIEFAGEQVEFFDQAVHPFGEAGVVFVTPGGFGGQLGVMLVATGDRKIPVLPTPSFRLGWYF